jgi:hypothetical protein
MHGAFPSTCMPLSFDCKDEIPRCVQRREALMGMPCTAAESGDELSPSSMPDDVLSSRMWVAGFQTVVSTITPADVEHVVLRVAGLLAPGHPGILNKACRVLVASARDALV